jgi:hypothetical protein
VRTDNIISSPVAAAVSIQQIAALKTTGLDVRHDGGVYRILTGCWAEVETLHQIVPDPEHSPYLVNGDFRIYLAMLIQ